MKHQQNLRHGEHGAWFPPLISGGPIEAVAFIAVPIFTALFPPLISGGPIEAPLVSVLESPPATPFPPLISGGPIEATFHGLTAPHVTHTFPPLISGGPIEAITLGIDSLPLIEVSAADQRRPR